MAVAIIEAVTVIWSPCEFQLFYKTLNKKTFYLTTHHEPPMKALRGAKTHKNK